MKTFTLCPAILSLLLCFTHSVFAAIPPATAQTVIDKLIQENPAEKIDIEKGVRQVARLWQDTDGDAQAFTSFCIENYITDPQEKETVFLKISDYLKLSTDILAKCHKN